MATKKKNRSYGKRKTRRTLNSTTVVISAPGRKPKSTWGHTPGLDRRDLEREDNENVTEDNGQ